MKSSVFLAVAVAFVLGLFGTASANPPAAPAAVQKKVVVQQVQAKAACHGHCDQVEDVVVQQAAVRKVYVQQAPVVVQQRVVVQEVQQYYSANAANVRVLAAPAVASKSVNVSVNSVSGQATGLGLFNRNRGDVRVRVR